MSPSKMTVRVYGVVPYYSTAGARVKSIKRGENIEIVLRKQYEIYFK